MVEGFCAAAERPRRAPGDVRDEEALSPSTTTSASRPPARGARVRRRPMLATRQRRARARRLKRAGARGRARVPRRRAGGLAGRGGIRRVVWTAAWTRDDERGYIARARRRGTGSSGLPTSSGTTSKGRRRSAAVGDLQRRITDSEEAERMKARAARRRGAGGGTERAEVAGPWPPARRHQAGDGSASRRGRPVAHDDDAAAELASRRRRAPCRVVDARRSRCARRATCWRARRAQPEAATNPRPIRPCRGGARRRRSSPGRSDRRGEAACTRGWRSSRASGSGRAELDHANRGGRGIAKLVGRPAPCACPGQHSASPVGTGSAPVRRRGAGGDTWLARRPIGVQREVGRNRARSREVGEACAAAAFAVGARARLDRQAHSTGGAPSSRSTLVVSTSPRDVGAERHRSGPWSDERQQRVQVARVRRLGIAPRAGAPLLERLAYWSLVVGAIPAAR